MEVEFWPGMIMSARAANIPLFLCNGQYPNKSYQRDKGRILSARDIVPGFAGVMVKSNRMAEPFRELGLDNIAITGEMRFEQPINQSHIDAAVRLRSQLSERPVLTFASAVKDEDALFIAAIQALKSRMPDALIVYVPRKPEHFDRAAELIQAAGLSVARRSVVLDATFELELPLLAMSYWGTVWVRCIFIWLLQIRLWSAVVLCRRVHTILANRSLRESQPLWGRTFGRLIFLRLRRSRRVSCARFLQTSWRMRF